MGIRFRSHGRPSFTVRAHGRACSPQNAVSASHIVAYRQTALSRAAARFIADRRLATSLRQVTMAHDLAPRARSQPAGTTGTPRPYSPMVCFVEPPSCIGSTSFEDILNTGLLSADASAAEASRSSGARRVVFRPSGAHLRSVGRAFGCCIMDVYTPQCGHEDRLHRAWILHRGFSAACFTGSLRSTRRRAASLHRIDAGIQATERRSASTSVAFRCNPHTAGVRSGTRPVRPSRGATGPLPDLPRRTPAEAGCCNEPVAYRSTRFPLRSAGEPAGAMGAGGASLPLSR